MSTLYDAVKITDRIYWVGAIDWSLRDFHGYETPRGSTYNAYLVLGEKVALIDTVRAPFRGELMGRIASVIDPRKIDVIVSNHSEMDHSGCLPRVIEDVSPERVLASVKGVENLSRHFHGLRDRVEAAADGGTLDLGGMALRFMETRMLHWPDSMMTYVPGEGVLFTQDAFGIHLASSERFADELPGDIVEYESAKYYANIIMPFGSRVAKTLEAIGKLEVRMIAPDHGPVYRRDLDRQIELYSRWVEQAPTRKAVVVYDSMWGSTARMARAIAEGLASGGSSVKLMGLKENHRSDIATEVLEAGALIVGSPTQNGQMFPTVADVLTYLRGLSPKRLIGAAFGSYGWSPKAVGQIAETLGQMKVELVGERVEVQYVPDDEALRRCRELGVAIAGRLEGARSVV
ncbi:MAG: FprA family A-type flavoprotein [Phycisphaerae bacterium]|nr:FprA family A-type flavoprotein [Phycisphaerae bacterium]